MKDTKETVLDRYHDLVSSRWDVLDPHARDLFFKSYERLFSRWLPPDRGAAILDAGCGEGAFLLFLKERGYQNLSGFDISPQNVAICHELGIHDVRCRSALTEVGQDVCQAYDCVFFLDVIEHIPKQQAVHVIAALRGLLCSGGSLIVQTPNAGSLVGLLAGYSDLTHEFVVNEDSARTLFRAAGFADAEIEIRAAWGARRIRGYVREAFIWLFHGIWRVARGPASPRIPTVNFLIRARRLRD